MGSNWKWSQRRGKQLRLEAEYRAHFYHEPVPTQPPLHSHDATLQSYFNRGWNSVTQSEIYRHTNQAPPMPKQTSGLQHIAALKHQLRKQSCHSQ